MTGSTADAKPEAPTGERFDPALTAEHLIEADHLARYAWASQFADGRRVLDAACGMAYGTALLAASDATEVVGVDLDSEVIANVSTAAPATARFEVADLQKLPFDEDEFDLITCFAAIEHVVEPELVLDELARVLRPDGLLLVSTPNRDVSAPGDPFHLRVLTPGELEVELDKRFRSVALRRQHSWVASGIFDDQAFTLGDHASVEGVELRKAAATRPGEETYTIAIASDGDLPVDVCMVSLTADVDVRDWSSRLDAADLALAAAPLGDDENGHAELELLRGELTQLRRQLASGEAELARFADLEARLAAAHGALQEHEALQARFDDLRGHYEALQGHHEQMIRSSSWRLTAPLRRLKALFDSTS